MNKKELRAEIKKLRSEADKEMLLRADKAIFEKIIASEEYIRCSSLLLYVSAEIEVDTQRLIAYSLKLGKAVYAPRVVKGTRNMDFCRIYSFDDLEEGYFGIHEPKNHCPICCSFGSDSLCIVPALAYDHNGFRLGYGKGFYDVFLSGFKGIKMGICYENCVKQTVFRDSLDVPVDILITEKNKLIFDRM